MLVQVNGNGLDQDAGGAEAIEAEVRRRLHRFEERLTRVEVHFEDVNAGRGGGDDKRARLELRPNSGAPIAVNDNAAAAGPALGGALGKAIAALDSHFGKLDSRR